MEISIIGAGIAGMTAAMHLQRQGHQVTIYEKTNHLGGRCASFQAVDNGQHLFSDVYEEFLALLQWLGNEQLLSKPTNLNVAFCDTNFPTTEYSLDCTKHKGLRGFADGMLHFDGIPMLDKIRLLKLLRMIRKNYIDEDTSVLALLKTIGISDLAIRRLWQPMVISLMNAPIELASATLFINTLHRLLFCGNNSFSLLHSTVPLSELFSGFTNKVAVRFGMCVDELLIEDNMCCGVKIKNGEKIFAGCVIATLPPNQLAKISSRLPDYVNIFPQSAIMSVEIATHKPIHNKKYVAYIGTNIQWLFNMDLLFNHKSDVYHYRATISRADDIIGFSNAELCEIFANELQQIAGIERCDIVAMKIVKNRNATSLLTFANNEQRPSAVQNIKGLYLAGDWINTGLPATAESAALSGKRVADCIFELN